MEKKYRIEKEIIINVPDDTPDSDVEEYIAFEFGTESSINNDNVVLKSGAYPVVTYADIYEL